MVGIRRGLVLGLLAAASLVGLLWLLGRAKSGNVDRAPEASKVAATADEVALELRAAEGDSGRRAIDAETAPRPTSPCTIRGRVLDPARRPIVGLAVTIYSLGAWNGETEDITVVIDGRETQGYATTTDESGRFRFEGPVPTARSVKLRVEADALHARAERSFDPWGTMLHAGENDLGDLTLLDAAAIEGRVLSANGEPVACAQVTVYCPGLPQAPFGRSDAEGRYSVGGLTESSVRPSVRAPGCLNLQGSWIDVRAGEVRRDVDFVVSPSPTIAGRAVDDRGMPVPGVLVRAAASGARRSVEARTSEDGSFTLHLVQNEPHVLAADHPGHEAFDGFHRGITVAPGTTDAVVELARLSPIRLCVVERSTGRPVERYGIELEVPISPFGIPSRDKPPPVGEHPGGCEDSLRPNRPFVAHVEAPGFAPASIELGDAIGHDVQLPLERASVIRGRVMTAGVPAVGARVRLERARTGKPRVLPDGSESFVGMLDDEMYDLNRFLGRSRFLRTDTEGRFELVDLAAGSYRLAVTYPGPTCPFEIDPLAVASAADRDLGDLLLSDGGSLRGTLRIAEGAPVDGWSVGLGDQDQGRRGFTESDGRFEITGLLPGTFDLWVDPPGTPSVVVQQVEIALGRTTEVDLDFTDRTPARIELHVTRAGAPLAGVRVVFGCGSDETLDLEVPTDAGGVAVATVFPCAALRASVIAGPEFEIAKWTSRSAIPPAGRVQEDFEVDAGELTLVLPDELLIPPGAIAMAAINAKDSRRRTRPLALWRPTEHSRDHWGVREWSGREVDIGLVPTGLLRVQFRIAVENRIQTTLIGDVEIRPLERATCVLALEGPAKAAPAPAPR